MAAAAAAAAGVWSVGPLSMTPLRFETSLIFFIVVLLKMEAVGGNSPLSGSKESHQLLSVVTTARPAVETFVVPPDASSILQQGRNITRWRELPTWQVR